ncbi:hypothetical protein [Nannocystis pusilla]|uniref:hypothetical protein n=1 Tax=Nannocystis pusilla TaxID=889268 RepID=UPI003B778145
MISGDLEGCWYTKIDDFTDNGPPSGVYLETGRELFIGELDGEPIQFTTTYKFESSGTRNSPAGWSSTAAVSTPSPTAPRSSATSPAGWTSRTSWKTEPSPFAATSAASEPHRNMTVRTCPSHQPGGLTAPPR